MKRLSYVLALLLCASIILAGCGRSPERQPETRVAVAPPGDSKALAEKPKPAEAKKEGDKEASKAASPESGGPNEKPSAARTGRLRESRPVETTPKALGIPAYPGAKTQSIPMDDRRRSHLRGSEIARLVTKDPYSKVVSYYKKNFSPNPREDTRSDRKMASFMKFSEDKGEMRLVFIREEPDNVEITMARTSSPQPMAGGPGMGRNRSGSGPEGRPGQPGMPPSGPPPGVKVVGDQKLAQKEIGIPLYPGAKVMDGSVLAREKAPGGRQTVLMLSTDDDISKVSTWYKQNFKSQESKQRKVEGRQVEGMSRVDEKNRTLYSVTFTERDKGTAVSLLKMRVPDDVKMPKLGG